MEIFETIMQSWGICGASVLSIIGAIAYAISEIKKIKTEIQGDNYNKELRESYKKLEKKIDNLAASNRELVVENKEKDKQLKILTDAVARVEGYSDEKAKNL